MTRETFISEMDRHVKLVRTEYGFTQDVMAKVLGISKKTLVEIEKGRSQTARFFPACWAVKLAI